MSLFKALNRISSGAYTVARVSRDVNAVARGPKAIAHRVVRKAAGRTVNGLLARALNRILK
jgi:hypothetical protein